MKTLNVFLNSISDIKDFVNIVSKYSYEIDLVSGRYVVDAKSILGVFGLDLSQILTVEYRGYNSDFENYLQKLAIAS